MSLSLEQRIAALEQEVADLKMRKAIEPGKDDWRQTIGMFTDNPGMLEIFAEAMKIREADRRKACQKARKRQRVKS
jgi:hypothetical protein